MQLYRYLNTSSRKIAYSYVNDSGEVVKGIAIPGQIFLSSSRYNDSSMYCIQVVRCPDAQPIGDLSKKKSRKADVKKPKPSKEEEVVTEGKEEQDSVDVTDDSSEKNTKDKE